MRRDSTAVIRDKFLSGKLTVTKVSVGKGTGRICLGCGRPISPDGVEDEIPLFWAASGVFRRTLPRRVARGAEARQLTVSSTANLWVRAARGSPGAVDGFDGFTALRA